MPPTSNIRKTQAQPMGTSHPNNALLSSATHGDLNPRRTTASGRAIRANTTRPTNYYARPFGSVGAAADHDVDMLDSANSQPPGFFPALQYFTDAITALPKEVMKQFTLMKEVEGKVHGPNEKLGELIDTLMEQPVPTRKLATNAGAGLTAAQGLLTLTANNSTSGSANVSMINGIAGRHSAQLSVNGSLDGDSAAEMEEGTRKRQQYHELRMLAHSLLPNLDEKNVVLDEANRVLAQQQTRLDSVWPHLENEISEEARLGSMTHWAYSDNRQKTKNTVAGAQRGRDVAATNNLAAAANMLHESEIAQARRDAGREAAREKAKGKRAEPAGDSDFGDKPRKIPKLGKAKAAAMAAASGLGISANGEPAPGRKGKKVVEKELAATGMMRAISSQGKASKAKETPRSTPTNEPVLKKVPKAKPGPPKKKVPGSAHNSPMLASSPLASLFNPNSVMEPPTNNRPQSARLRQNSTATNLRYERLQEDETSSRPVSAAGKPNGNGERSRGRKRVQDTIEDTEEHTSDEKTNGQLKAASEKLKREVLDMPHASVENRQIESRSGSNSRKGSGRQSKVGTPRQESFHSGDAASMQRPRSTRTRHNTKDGSSSAEPQIGSTGFSRHKRNMSNSHLVKQLAPFNRSPDLDRHKENEDGEEDNDSPEEPTLEDDPDREEKAPTPEMETRRSSTRRPLSRRNTVNMLRSSPAPMSRDSSPPASPPPTSSRGSGRTTTVAREAAARDAEAEAEAAAIAETEAEAKAEADADVDVDVDVDGDIIEVDNAEYEGEEDSEHDPDDPNEPKYCYCNRGSYGEMVACDNEACPREWFHLGCTELRQAPSEDVKWYCRQCKPSVSHKVGRKSKAGRGRGG